MLTPTFKQAIEDGIVHRAGIEVDLSGGKDSTAGWVTERFGVIDIPVAHRFKNTLYEGYAITHLESGRSLWSMAAHHVALNFMLELERELPDIDFYDDSKIVIQYLKTRGMHECQTYLVRKDNNLKVRDIGASA